MQDNTTDWPPSCATESDAHCAQRSAAHSSAHTVQHSTTTVDSIVYGVGTEDTDKVLKVLQHVTVALQLGNITSMLYNAALSAESSYQAVQRYCAHVLASRRVVCGPVQCVGKRLTAHLHTKGSLAIKLSTVAYCYR